MHCYAFKHWSALILDGSGDGSHYHSQCLAALWFCTQCRLHLCGSLFHPQWRLCWPNLCATACSRSTSMSTAVIVLWCHEAPNCAMTSPQVWHHPSEIFPHVFLLMQGLAVVTSPQACVPHPCHCIMSCRLGSRRVPSFLSVT